MKLQALLASVAVLLVVGCGDSSGGATTGSGGSGGTSGDGGSGPGPSGGGNGDGGNDGPSSSNSGNGSSGTGGAGTGSGSASGSNVSASASTSDASATVTVSSGSTGGGTDLYAEERAACVAHINTLRATKGAYAYEQWGDGETCADEQATSDEETGSAHGAFGACGESAQNECLGHGVGGIIQCLDSMWAEKDLPGCAGCDACALGDQSGCDNCDFFGQATGDVCVHYVNMRSLQYSETACGFSELGGWDVINFR
jgi:hypothetical protein